jgi:anti-sigma-K factor RskA
MAAAAALLIIIAGVVLLRPQQPPDPAQLYAQIAADPKALHFPVSPVSPAVTSGEMVVSADGTQAVVRVENLPEIKADQTYQLWLVDPNGAHSGGLMKFADPHGPNYIPLPLDKPIKDYVGFGVSIEPEGGSPTSNAPSGPRAFGVTISS